MKSPVAILAMVLGLIVAVSLFIGDIQTLATDVGSDSRVTGVTAWGAVLDVMPFLVLAAVAGLGAFLIWRAVK